MSFPLSGEIDLATAPDLAEDLRTFQNISAGDVEIDCSRLSFIDCAGVRVLVAFRHDLALSSRRLEFVNLCGMPSRVFQILQILQAAPSTDFRGSRLVGTGR